MDDMQEMQSRLARLCEAQATELGRELRRLRQRRGLPAPRVEAGEAPDSSVLGARRAPRHPLLDCLAKRGVSVDATTYNAFEAGTAYPRDPCQFLDALARCLELTPEEHRALFEQLGYDMLRTELGDEWAAIVFVHGRP